MSTAISVRLPKDLADQLDGIAKETERPRSFIIQKALESYIEDFADLQIALDRLHDRVMLLSGRARVAAYNVATRSRYIASQEVVCAEVTHP